MSAPKATSEYAAMQRRMKHFVSKQYAGEREYVPNSALPEGGGIWSFWTRPTRGGKAREERESHQEIMKSKHES